MEQVPAHYVSKLLAYHVYNLITCKAASYLLVPLCVGGRERISV